MTDLVIFDCDGVLVDSETVVSRAVSRELRALGWDLSPEQCERIFAGLTLSDMVPLVEARCGALPAGWVSRLGALILDELTTGVQAMPGAVATLRAMDALNLPWCVASNSSQAEMRLKFSQSGLESIIPPGRRFSAEDAVARGGRGKPAPDLFLLAAAAHGAAPSACVVVEDSVPGATGGAAAGMRVIGLARHGAGGGSGTALREAGAVALVQDLAELPAAIAALLAREPA